MEPTHENYQIIQRICSLPAGPGKGHKELNLISWYGRMPVYDLREWASDGTPRKGITLTEEELTTITQTLKEDQKL